MNRLHSAVTAAAALATCLSLTGAASAQSEEQVSSLATAIAASGYLIDGSNSDAVLAASGLSEETRWTH